MSDFTFDTVQQAAVAASPEAPLRWLSETPRGLAGTIVHVRGPGAGDYDDVERRLLELGFVEGAKVEILHTGLLGRDPMAVRLDDSRVALRRREAAMIQVSFTGGGLP